MNLLCFLLVYWLPFSTSAEPIAHPDKISLPGAPLSPEFNIFSGYLNGSSNESEAPIFYVYADVDKNLEGTIVSQKQSELLPSLPPLLIWFNGGPGASSLGTFFKEGINISKKIHSKMFLFLLTFSFFSGRAFSVSSDHHPHKVISLPGAPLSPVFNLFAGHLNGSSNATEAPIFYVLAEAIRVDPSTAPLIIWFNGGPGGSSLGAFFKGHGPYRVTESGDALTYHEFSWNQYANVLYLESPLGVGFSQNSEGDLTLNDLDAAELNFNSLRDFMTKIHPNYANREYFLTGQSYAGAYVPYFARRLLKGIKSNEMRNINFKGFAIGNPVIERISRILANLMHIHSYGLVPSSVMEIVLNMWLKFEKGEKLRASEVDEMNELLGIIIYKSITWNSPLNYNFAEHCNKKVSYEDYHVSSEKLSISCYGGAALLSYMNRDDVQTAFHVGNSSAGKMNWTAINLDIADRYYKRDGNVSHVYDDIFRLTDNSSFRVLVYNGDTDVMVSSAHTLYNTEKIAMTNSMEDLRDTAWDFYGDFAGIRRSYKKGNVTMDVLTVRGAGHSVPTDLPAQAFQMIHNFIFAEDNQAIDYSKPIRKH